MKFACPTFARLYPALPVVGWLACAQGTGENLAPSRADASVMAPASPDGAAALVRVDGQVGAADASAAVAIDGAASAPPPEASCTPVTSGLQPRPAEVVLLLDRSSGMSAPVLATGSPWLASTAGIEAATRSAAVAWGMMLFPKPSPDGNPDDACCQMPSNDAAPDIEVAPATATEPAIADLLASTAATGMGRPLARAIVQAGNYLLARPTSTAKYLVLLASGEPTCATDAVCSDTSLDDARTKDSVTHVSSLLGIPVGVVAVGLGSAANALQPTADQQFFADLAKLGGLPNTTAGQPAYYGAASADEVAAALSALAAQMRSCSFALPAQVVSRTDVQVSLSGLPVARDPAHQNGWDFADYGTSIVLFGKPCATVRAASGVAEVEFATFCPNPVI